MDKYKKKSRQTWFKTADNLQGQTNKLNGLWNEMKALTRWRNNLEEFGVGNIILLMPL